MSVYRLVGANLVLEAEIPRPLEGWSAGVMGRFGESLAIQDDLLVIGDPSSSWLTGLAWVYRRVGSTWTLEQALRATDSNQGDFFGSGVAISDGRVIVSAPKASEWLGSSWKWQTGTLSVFAKSGSAWSIVEKHYGADVGVHLGERIALDGDRLVASARGARQLYVFEKSGSAWQRAATLATVYSDGWEPSVAISGDSIFFGEDDIRKVQAYSWNGTTWVQAPNLTPSYAASAAGFGGNMAASGRVLYVSGQGTDSRNRLTTFVQGEHGWSEQSTYLLPGDSWLDEWMGWSGSGLTMAGDQLVLGSPFDDRAGLDAGSVTLFDRMGCPTSVGAGGLLDVKAPGVLLNDMVAVGTTCTVELVGDAQHGALTLRADGSFTYEPAPGYQGADAFTYRLVAKDGASGEVTVDLWVNPVGTISGAVKDAATGRPLGAMVVRVANASSSNPETDPSAKVTLTGSDGSYSVSGLSPGDYIVTFIDRNGVYRDEHLWGGGLPAAFSRSVALGEGESIYGANGYLDTKASLLAARTTRVAGDSRYTTSIASALMKGHASSAVIASGLSFPDALAASGLAGVYDSAIFLTKPTQLPVGTIDAMKKLGVGQVFIVGGTSAVSLQIQTALWDAGFNVARLGGSDRYATGDQVARMTLAGLPSWGDGGVEPFVVRGDAFADALAVAPFAYMFGKPIILVKPDSAPSASIQAFSFCKSDGVFVVGGKAAVSDAALIQLGQGVGLDTIYTYRISGADRYETSAKVATAWGMPFDWAGLASGANFADALSGGPTMGAYGGPLLLTPPTSLHAAPKAVLSANGKYLWQVIGFGGPAALSDAVLRNAGAATGIQFYEMDGYSGVAGASAPLGIKPLFGQAAAADALDNANVSEQRVVAGGLRESGNCTLPRESLKVP